MNAPVIVREPRLAVFRVFSKKGTIRVFSIPDRLYHGTTKEAADKMICNGLIDPSKWRPGTDFGPAFYTTTSFDRAYKWQKHLSFRSPSRTGAVITVGVDKRAVKADVRLFQHATLDWAEYVLYHRLKLCRDCCRDRHADIVRGPIADNVIADWLQKFNEQAVKSIQDQIDRFHEFITTSPVGYRLSEAQLGTQVAFCNPYVAGAILRIENIEYFGPASGGGDR